MFFFAKNKQIKKKYIKKNEKKYISLEDKLFDDIRIEDTIIDDDNSIIEKIILKETNNELYTILDTKLDDIERKIIKMSFGIGCREYKQKEIANILNIPQYKVSRIKKRVLERLKKCMELTI